MNLYFICTKDNHQSGYRLFQESHYIDLANGKILLSAKFDNINPLNAWRKHPGVVELPHPLSGGQVGHGIASDLAELGVLPSDTVYQVGKKAAERHHIMELHI